MTEPIIEFKDFHLNTIAKLNPLLKRLISKLIRVRKFSWPDLQAAANLQLVAALMVLFQILIKATSQVNA